MIEEILIEYLGKSLGVMVCAEVPEGEEMFVVVERTGGGLDQHISSATFAIQSYAPTMYQAAELNKKVKKAMDSIIMLDAITKSQLNADYNYTDTTKKNYRYQAVYDLIYYDD